MASQTDLVIPTLQGGQNDQDPKHILPDDQCVLAENVEFFFSTLGERRRGMASVDITSSGLDAEAAIVHLGMYSPTLGTPADSVLVVKLKIRDIPAADILSLTFREGQSSR